MARGGLCSRLNSRAVKVPRSASFAEDTYVGWEKREGVAYDDGGIPLVWRMTHGTVVPAGSDEAAGNLFVAGRWGLCCNPRGQADLHYLVGPECGFLEG